MSDVKKLVGGRIREMRKGKDWSQATLAEKVGVADSYIASIERGERNLSLASLEKIVHSLGAEMSDMFRFGTVEFSGEQLDKRTIIRQLASFLEERSLEEAELVHRIALDMMDTFDKQKKN